MTTTTTTLAVVPPRDDWSTFQLLVKQADVLAQSRIIPRAYQGKQYDIIAAGMAGQTFGWDLMTSLRNYHVIEGTASMRPEAMLGLVRQHGHSVTIKLAGQDLRAATAHGRRADNGDEHTATFTTTDAKNAGLLNKNNWRQYQDAMLTWRAVSALCRVLFPDVVLGAGYVPEELGATVDDAGNVPELEADSATTTVALLPPSVAFDNLVDVRNAKAELLEACEGDKELARRLWGDRVRAAITRDELDDLMAQALSEPVLEHTNNQQEDEE